MPILDVGEDLGVFIWSTIQFANIHHNRLEIMAHNDSKHTGATEDELIDICSSSDHDIIDGEPFSNLAIKLSDEAVVRLGIRVKRVEAKILKGAYNLLDHCIVRIPRVYRFFTCNSLGYIVMEYVEVGLLIH